ncbi:OLC1v1021313C1 [Oldenlandia corymbosa var. corymbosa]|uniref:OLC1v1021313C1 n=1 Tax=Oldenlandia corymbosa var. corymbosa TaxID=529605 RepID=A0AAV1BWW1_OLDCO|nr:OLC1v1021313C1 [Oldenlandia corymbosa var. corymbosa]
MAQPNYPPVDQPPYPPYPPTTGPPQLFYPPPPVVPTPYPDPASTKQEPSGSQHGYATAYAYPSPAAPPVYPPTPIPAVSPTQSGVATPIPVVGPQYCLPRPVDLIIVRKLMTLTDDFMVTDVAKNTMFKVKGKFFSLHDKRVLLDAAGRPVITLSHKVFTAHSRWQVFRGESSHPADLLFTAKTSSMIQLKTKLNVYLANRKSEDFCDFKVHGSWTDRSCVVYVGESSTIAAQVRTRPHAHII